MQRQPVLDRVDAGLDREPRSLEPLGMRCDANAQPVRLVDDRLDLLARELRGLGILALHRACARRHELHEVGAAAKLRADRAAHLPRPVGLVVHRPEDRAAR